MRLRSIAATGVLLAVVAATGCGGAGPVSTGTISAGSTVKPEQYLADTRAASVAINDFAAIVNGLPNPLTSARLRSAAQAMADPLERLRDVEGRLVAMRLEDKRLDAQRADAQAAIEKVLAAMQSTRSAAVDGDAAAAKDAAARLGASIAALRAAGRQGG